MSQKNYVYKWSKKDRMLSLLPAVPLIAFYIGSTYLLARNSINIAGVFLLFWVAVNVPMAGICAGCPYRGEYCPGLCQLYFAPFLSTVLYKRKKREPGIHSFKIHLILLGVFGIGGYIFGFYWLFRLYWQEHPLVVIGLLLFLLLHMPLSFFILCPKCSYNDTCPMANVHKVFKKVSNSEEDGPAPSD